jgi:tRNA-specific 2-thiouridylase
MFPLGDLESKAAVRELARRWNLPTAEQRESMGICFVGQRRSKFADFLQGYLESVPGDIVEHGTGRVVGQHQGLWRYTIGEGAKVGGLPVRMFVARKDPVRNTITIAPKE